MIPILRIIPDAIGALLRLVGLISDKVPAVEAAPNVPTEASAGGGMLDKKTAAVVTIVGNVVLGILALVKFLVTKELDDTIITAIGGVTGTYALARGVEGTVTARTKGPQA